MDDHYQVKIPESNPNVKDPVKTLDMLREQIIEIFNDRFDLTHGFKARLNLTGKMSRSTDYLVGIFDDGNFTTEEKDFKQVPFKNKAVAVTSKEDISQIVNQLIWNIERRIDDYVQNGSGWYWDKADFAYIEMPVYEPLATNTHLPLPERMLTSYNGIINIQNEDNQYFERSILADLYKASYYQE